MVLDSLQWGLGCPAGIPGRSPLEDLVLKCSLLGTSMNMLCFYMGHGDIIGIERAIMLQKQESTFGGSA